MRVFLIIISVMMAGCHSTPPRYRAGDVAIAVNFTNYPHYNETPVTVTGAFGWRWIKGGIGNTLRCYEVTTVDGNVLAAQSFQLRPAH